MGRDEQCAHITSPDNGGIISHYNCQLRKGRDSIILEQKGPYWHYSVLFRTFFTPDWSINAKRWADLIQFSLEEQIIFNLPHLIICLLKKYRKNVPSFITPEIKSEPKRNSVLTRSILVGMLPKLFSTLVYTKKVLTFHWAKIHKLLSWEPIVLD